MTKAPKYTPWGAPDSAVLVGEGIWFITTPSHGGYYLEPAANERVPLFYRDCTFDGQGLDGFYEGDSDACIVPVFLPESFEPDQVATALTSMARQWIQFAMEKESAA